MIYKDYSLDYKNKEAMKRYSDSPDYSDVLKQYSELQNIIREFCTSNPRDYDSWVKQHHLKEYLTAAFEIRLVPESGPLHISLRQICGTFFFMIEHESQIAECDPEAKMTLGLSLQNPTVYPLWVSMRLSSVEQNSICTRKMPLITCDVLKTVYDMHDENILIAFINRLRPFGTKHFGKKDFDISDPINEYQTPYYICYAPGELEAIAEVSAKMLKGITSVEEVYGLDMNVFKRELAKQVEGIQITPDIVLFGRHTNGSGLGDFESCLSLDIPFSVDSYPLSE